MQNVKLWYYPEIDLNLGIIQAQAMAAHRDNIIMFRVETVQPFAQAAYQGVQGLHRDLQSFGIAPDSRAESFPADNLPGIIV